LLAGFIVKERVMSLRRQILGLIALLPTIALAQGQAPVVRPPTPNRPLPNSQLPVSAATNAQLAKPTVTRVSFVPSGGPAGSNTVRIEGNLFGATTGTYGIKALVQQGGREFSGRCLLPQHREICSQYTGNIFLRVRQWSPTEVIAEYDPVGYSVNVTNGQRRIVESACRPSNTTDHHCMSLEQIRRFVAGSIGVGLVTPGTDQFVSTTAQLNITPPATRPAGTRDADGDGVLSRAHGGTDCDDQDPRRFPGNPEVGDFDGLDEDCFPTTFGEQDRDGDRYFNYAFFNGSPGNIYQGDDCDDSSRAAHPAATEVCDGIDNNCDGYVDELPMCR
jgi:hypothetical protein